MKNGSRPLKVSTGRIPYTLCSVEAIPLVSNALSESCSWVSRSYALAIIGSATTKSHTAANSLTKHALSLIRWLPLLKECSKLRFGHVPGVEVANPVSQRPWQETALFDNGQDNPGHVLPIVVHRTDHIVRVVAPTEADLKVGQGGGPAFDGPAEGLEGDGSSVPSRDPLGHFSLVVG